MILNAKEKVSAACTAEQTNHVEHALDIYYIQNFKHCVTPPFIQSNILNLR